MRRCVIVSAGQIENYCHIKKYLQSDDFFIFCDGGLRHAKALEVQPSLIIGDFDSATQEDLLYYSKNCQTIKLPRMKDDTDTMFAVKTGLERGFNNFLLLGSMGFRFDHALANASVLLYLFEQKKSATILDDYSLMEVAGTFFCDNAKDKDFVTKKVFIEDTYSYFSVLTPFGNACGVSIKNAKFPLENAELKSDFQSLGISNEVLKGKRAEVSVTNGLVLVVKVF